jgi:phospholipase C
LTPASIYRRLGASGAFIASLALAACASSASAVRTTPFVPAVTSAAQPPVGTYIKHVVVIIQENRTFDNLFAGFPGADAPLYGYMKTGRKIRKIPLRTIDFTPLVNVDHDFGPAIHAWDHGKMDGFNGTVSGLAPDFPYAHLRKKDVRPYWDMASQYVLADHMFPTEFGPSFTGHLSLIAGTTSLSPTVAVANNPIGGPWGCDAAPGTITFTVNVKRVVSGGPFPCYTQFHTMADVLDAAGVSWKYYAPGLYANKGGTLWSSFDAIHSVRYSPDWKNNVVSPQTQVLSDAANGTLPAVSWVIPDWEWSDHASTGSDLGPSWVAAVVNAIGKGPDWSSTAIVIVWDDWGGWYDNVPPPQLDYRGNGIRVGCIIISPYARPHYVSHTDYEFGSILKFEEQAFGLSPLGPTADGYTDSRANSIVDSFDFTQTPLSFTPIKAPYPPSRFIDQKPSGRPPDTDL